MENKCGTEDAAPVGRGIFARTTGIAAYCLTAAGAIYCTVMTAVGKFGADGYVYKISGAAISAALYAAFFAFERLTRLRAPDFTDAFLKIFIACALVLGRCFEFYALVPYWDKILHVGAFTFGNAHGMSGKRRAAALTLFAFLFALAAGYVWELFEFAGDSLFGMNNQNWEAGLIAENADGTFTVSDKRGTALLDTLGDMYVNFIGAATCFAVCFVRYFRHPEKLSEIAVKRLPGKDKPPREKNA